MKKTVKVRVPATSANCGPGYDSMGVALTLYNEFSYTVDTKSDGIVIDVQGEGADVIGGGRDNLAVEAFMRVWHDVCGSKEPGLKISMLNRVPQSRGLGSSSTAIVAGVMAADFVTESHMSREEMLQYANAVEGHPDNVAPAIFGGFTVSILEEGRALTVPVAVKLPLRFIAVVPEFPLSTSKARAVIPEKVAHKDAVFNASRAALLVAALVQGDKEHIAAALEDRLHQPYRSELIPGCEAVFEAACAAGAYKCIISGAGSTLMAYAAPEADADAIAEAMVKAFNEAGLAAKYYILEQDTAGAEIIQ